MTKHPPTTAAVMLKGDKGMGGIGMGGREGKRRGVRVCVTIMLSYLSSRLVTAFDLESSC